MFALLILLSPMVSSHPNPSLYADGSLDNIERTRAQAELLKENLWSISSNPENMEIINRVFAEKNPVCIHSMEDAINAIETGTKLVQNAGAELKQLFQPIQSFNDTVTPAEAVKVSAAMIRLIDIFIPKITPSAPFFCGHDDPFASFNSLVALLEELSAKDELYFSLQTRQELKFAIKIVSNVINFLSKLQTSLSQLNRLCTMDRSYNIEAINSIASLMADLADL